MARLIDADAFKADLEKLAEDAYQTHDWGTVSILEDCIWEVDSQPTVDAVPVVHGRWVLIEEGQNTSIYQCSKCNRMVNVVCDRNLRKRQLAKNYPYCNCGAKMDLEVE